MDRADGVGHEIVRTARRYRGGNATRAHARRVRTPCRATRAACSPHVWRLGLGPRGRRSRAIRMDPRLRAPGYFSRSKRRPAQKLMPTASSPKSARITNHERRRIILFERTGALHSSAGNNLPPRSGSESRRRTVRPPHATRRVLSPYGSCRPSDNGATRWNAAAAAKATAAKKNIWNAISPMPVPRMAR